MRPILLGTIVCFGDAVGKNRVIDEELHSVDALRIRTLARHVVEECRHAERIVARGRHGGNTDAIGLELARARVVDLMLYRGALARQDGALDGVGVAAAGRCAEQHRGQHGGRRQQPVVGLVDKLPHQMALGNVRGFVSKDAG